MSTFISLKGMAGTLNIKQKLTSHKRINEINGAEDNAFRVHFGFSALEISK